MAQAVPRPGAGKKIGSIGLAIVGLVLISAGGPAWADEEQKEVIYEEGAKITIDNSTRQAEVVESDGTVLSVDTNSGTVTTIIEGTDSSSASKMEE